MTQLQLNNQHHLGGWPRLLPEPTPLPEKAGDTLVWQGLYGSADAYAVAELAQRQEALVLVVTRHSASAQRWQTALDFLQPPPVNADVPGADVSNLNTLHFPDWETLPYDAFSPHQDITSERLRTLVQLPATRQGMLTVPITTLMQKIAPCAFLQSTTFSFTRGQTLDISQQRKVLDDGGYLHTDTVTERGEYAVRGSVMDIYPMGAQLPVRIDLFDDEIDTLRTFDPDSQRTVSQIDALELLPAKEFPFDAAAIGRFRDRWHHTFNVDIRRCSVYQDVSSHITPNGVEYYLPFFFDQLGTLFDYLPKQVIVVLEDGVFAAAQHHLDEIKHPL